MVISMHYPQSSQFPTFTPQIMPHTQSHFMPSSQFSVPNFRNFPRGRGRGPRLPCDICGRQNHSTNFCHYRGQFGQFQPSFDIYSTQWRGSTSSSPWMSSAHYPSGLPLFKSSMPMTSASVPGPRQPMIHPSHSQPQTPFAGFTEAYTMPYMNPGPSYSSATFSRPPGFTEAFNMPYMTPSSSDSSHGFSGAFNMPYMTPSSSGSPHGFSVPATQVSPNGLGLSGEFNKAFSAGSAYGSPASQPWYFDSGATNHITNNVQNSTQTQPAQAGNGVLVGNGSTLPVIHTGKGQEYTPNLVPGTLLQGSISTSELL